MIASGPRDLLEVARWVDTNIKPEDVEKPRIVSRKLNAGYYLNMEWEYFPVVESYPELIDALRTSSSSYLLFGLMEAGMRPQSMHLLDPAQAPPELVPLVYTYSPPTVLYKMELPSE
jgi:hypothetical protein